MQDELTRLKNEYRAELPEKLRVISEAVQNVIRSCSNGMAPDWKQLEFLVHKFAGSAGTYGFVQMSPHARTLEDRIIDGSLPALSAKESRAELERWLSALKAMVDLETQPRKAA